MSSSAAQSSGAPAAQAVASSTPACSTAPALFSPEGERSSFAIPPVPPRGPRYPPFGFPASSTQSAHVTGFPSRPGLSFPSPRFAASAHSFQAALAAGPATSNQTLRSARLPLPALASSSGQRPRFQLPGLTTPRARYAVPPLRGPSNGSIRPSPPVQRAQANYYAQTADIPGPSSSRVPPRYPGPDEPGPSTRFAPADEPGPSTRRAPSPQFAVPSLPGPSALRAQAAQAAQLAAAAQSNDSSETVEMESAPTTDADVTFESVKSDQGDEEGEMIEFAPNPPKKQFLKAARIVKPPKQLPLTIKPLPVTVDRMAEYLDNPDDYNVVVIFRHPKVVQRSYGKERRFFVPPPVLIMHGPGWRQTRSALADLLGQERSRLHDLMFESDERKDAAAVVKYRDMLNRVPNLPIRMIGSIGLNDENKPFSAEFDNELVAKGIFITNQDRRRYFRMNVELTSYLGPSTACPLQWLGDFGSSEVRVVSKPPKKQKSGTNESALVCIKSGMQITLYNRIAGGNVKFLHVQGDHFYASHSDWCTFNIYSVSEEQGASPNSPSFEVEEGFILYGSVVRLVEVKSGLSLPNLIVRKVEKTEVLLTTSYDEPIAQMQRVALQLCDTECGYLGISLSQILCRDLPWLHERAHQACDSVTWTVAEADYCEYKFFESMGPAIAPVTPIPMVVRLHLEITCNQNAVMEVSGLCLGKHLDIWFGLCKAEIMSANAHYMRCRVPTLQAVSETPNSDGSLVVDDDRGVIRVPITFAREDGVLYPTDCYFDYNTVMAGGIGAPRVTGIHERQKRLFEAEMRKYEERMDMDSQAVQDEIMAASSSSSRKRAFR